ncbi:hypothetical protein J1614_004433 [Plenodomus biglobosus]|nr:hypothetical protein J1614_004433 [Plenodomus biglobosus]
MLATLQSTAIPPPRTQPPIRLDKVCQRARQIVISALQLLEVFIINQALLPQVVKEMEVWATGAQRLPPHRVRAGEMLHAGCPGVGAVRVRGAPVAEGALDAARGLFAAKVREAVCLPVWLRGEEQAAVEEPEGALVDGCAGGGGDLENAVAVLEQGEAGELAGQRGADGCLGRCCVRVWERRGQRGRVVGGGVEAVQQGGRHGGAGPDGDGTARARRGQGRVGQAVQVVAVQVVEAGGKVVRLPHPVVDLRADEGVEPGNGRQRHVDARGVCTSAYLVSLAVMHLAANHQSLTGGHATRGRAFVARHGESCSRQGGGLATILRAR